MDTRVEQSANTLSASATASNGYPKDGSGMPMSADGKHVFILTIYTKVLSS